MSVASTAPRTDVFGDPLPPGAIARLGTVRFAATAYAFAVAASPDGTRIASGHEDGVLRVRDASDGRLLFAREAHPGGVRDVAYSGAALFSVGVDGRVLEWSATGEVVQTVGDVDREVFSIAVNGGVIAAGAADGRITLFGAKVTLAGAHRDRVDDVAFSSDGRLLASASWDRTVRLHDLASGAEGRVLSHSDAVYAVVISSDGAAVFSGGRAGNIDGWDVKTGRRLRSWRAHSGGVTSLSLVDGQLISTGAEGQIARWDPSTGRELWRAGKEGTELRSVAVLGDRLVAGGGSSRLRFFAGSSGQEIDPQPGVHGGDVQCLAFSADGRRVVTGTTDGKARVFDAKSGRLETIVGEGGAPLVEVAFDSDGSAVTVAQDGQLRRFPAGGGAASTSRRLWPKGAPAWVKLSSDGREVALSRGDRLVVEPVGGGAALYRVALQGSLLGLRFGSPPVPMMQQEGALRVGERSLPVPSGISAASLSAGGGSISLVVPRSEGRFEIVFGALEGSRSSVVIPGYEIRRAVFSPDDRRLVVAGQYRHVRHRVASGKGWILSPTPEADAVAPKVIELDSGHMRILLGHDGGVGAVAFSPDGKLLATAGADSTVLVWQIE